MNRFLRALGGVAWIVFTLSLAPPVAALQPERLAEALQAVAARDFDKAQSLAGAAGDPIATDIVDWHRLRAGRGTWSEYQRFLSQRSDWPGLPLMRRRAESVMPSSLPADQVRAFFARQEPQTARGVLVYTAALGREAAKAERARAWTTLTMGRSDRALFLQRFGKELKPLHAQRLDMLLWNGQTTAAKELLGLVPPADAALGRARIALQDKTNGVDALIKAIPAVKAGDPGLAHDRFRWRLDKGLRDTAETLLLERSVSAASLGKPEKWASSRRSMARQAMRDGRISTAYRLASQHFLTGGSSFSDLEWLSGYIALTYRNDAGLAVQHFERFRRAVETPISLGRAGYWLGRANEAAGNRQAARAAYEFGGRFQTSFYGQLAAERIGLRVDGSLARWGGLPGWQGRQFAKGSPIRAARALQTAGDTVLALRFLLHVQESLGPEDSAALARLAVDIDQTTAAVQIAKRLVRAGVIYPEAYYPVTRLAKQSGPVRPELAMSIARQESELNPKAVSPAGARGLMQLMPATAKKVASDLELAYSLDRLTADPGYNARLGTTYLSEMLKRFDGSVLLAAAAYNAGPHRVDRWIARYGDPRRRDVDAIRWIEHIPFRETRNYVMRVLESQHVYRTRINRNAGAIGLSRTLGLGG